MEDGKEKSRSGRRRRPDGDSGGETQAELYSPEQREALLAGLRVLAKVAVRAHMGRDTAEHAAEQDGGNGEE